MLPVGVAVWSAATLAVPTLASTVPGLCLSRAAVGLGEGVAPSSATDLVARSIHPSERSRAISFIFGGLHVGTLAGLLVAPFIIENFGWQTVFYVFGGLGLGWTWWWERGVMADLMRSEPELMSAYIDVDASSIDENSTDEDSSTNDSTNTNTNNHHGGVISHRQSVPWRAFLRNRPVQALMFVHYANNWFHYTMLAWLPTYFTDSLSLNLMKAAQVSLLPPTAAIIVSAIAGPSADYVIERKLAPIAVVRKAAQCAAFLGPAACLLAVCGIPNDNGTAEVALISLSLGLASFSLAGLYCNHADLSPRYASVLLGLTNTSGAIPGIMGVAFTGWLFDKTSSWTLSLFLPCIVFFVLGSLVFVLFGSGERQDFSDNSPFAWERWLGNNTEREED